MMDAPTQIMLAIFAVTLGLINIWITLGKPTVESRVKDLQMVVVVDVLILFVYQLMIGDQLMAAFLTYKYLFFCFVDFDETLRGGL